MMTPQRWLSLWETTMLYGLEGCRGVPTIFFSSGNIIPDIRGALKMLKGLLEGGPADPHAGAGEGADDGGGVSR